MSAPEQPRPRKASMIPASAETDLVDIDLEIDATVTLQYDGLTAVIRKLLKRVNDLEKGQTNLHEVVLPTMESKIGKGVVDMRAEVDAKIEALQERTDAAVGKVTEEVTTTAVSLNERIDELRAEAEQKRHEAEDYVKRQLKIIKDVNNDFAKEVARDLSAAAQKAGESQAKLENLVSSCDTTRLQKVVLGKIEQVDGDVCALYDALGRSKEQIQKAVTLGDTKGWLWNYDNAPWHKNLAALKKELAMDADFKAAVQNHTMALKQISQSAAETQSKLAALTSRVDDLKIAANAKDLADKVKELEKDVRHNEKSTKEVREYITTDVETTMSLRLRAVDDALAVLDRKKVTRTEMKSTMNKMINGYGAGGARSGGGGSAGATANMGMGSGRAGSSTAGGYSVEVGQCQSLAKFKCLSCQHVEDVVSVGDIIVRPNHDALYSTLGPVHYDKRSQGQNKAHVQYAHGGKRSSKAQQQLVAYHKWIRTVEGPHNPAGANPTVGISPPRGTSTSAVDTSGGGATSEAVSNLSAASDGKLLIADRPTNDSRQEAAAAAVQQMSQIQNALKHHARQLPASGVAGL